MRKSPIKKVKKAWSFGREKAMKESSLGQVKEIHTSSLTFWSGQQNKGRDLAEYYSRSRRKEYCENVGSKNID